MSPDPNKKSERAFQCRDVLWETFEQMARELECSVDYLINEAMKQYARQRSRARTDSVPAAPGLVPAMGPRVPTASPSGPVPQAGGGLAAGPRPVLPAPPAPLPAGGGYLPPPPLPPPPVIAPRPGAVGVGAGPPARPMAPALGARAPALAGPPMPATPAPMHVPLPPHAVAAHAPGVRSLTAVYMGEQVPITKERFVIGRGRQSSDLTIKDPNVSRQHAMVEFYNGQYYMVDLGSTNGVEYNGQRITKQLIADGDTFRICDHEVRFVFA
jgi:hypothetical protein